MAGALGNQTSPLTVVIIDDEEDTEGPEPLTFDWLRRRTLWEKAALDEVISALTEPPGAQIVLAGPPGTGKTWVAKHVVRYLTQDRPLAYRIVQFHPSYGYEEFIEGLRPIVTDSGIEFTRVDGLVLEVVNQMEEGDDLHFVVIDEMNRANLPRVFGELMYLLEYRGEDESIDLQYSRDFSLPHNLRFIGTMNTADRSIRSIDTALRRRFEIIDCPPDARLLEAYYDSHENQVADLMAGFIELNRRLEEHLDRHHTIGHTFFMKDPMTPERLEMVWKRQVAPLIEEYFFDQPGIATSYDPNELWPGMFSSSS
jgi:5-methylcytosine-specific restriction endonuclease McrBC GTP-binding regulatory subunit McrB